MDFFKDIMTDLNCRYNLNDKWYFTKEWLKKDQYKLQRKVAFASCLFAMAMVILLISSCSHSANVGKPIDDKVYNSPSQE
jgi:hypothetical protein